MNKILVLASVISTAGISYGRQIKVSNYGYEAKAQIDLIHDFKPSTLAPNSDLYREFSISQIPTTEIARKAFNKSAVSPNQSSFGSFLEIDSELGKSYSFMDVNLMGSMTSPELQIYRAYTKLNGLKFGFDFTNFSNPRSFTKTLNFEGPTAMPVIRTGQISYTHEIYPNNYLTAALEDIPPEVSGPSLSSYVVNQAPAVILKGTSVAEHYEVEIAGIYRRMKVLDATDSTYDQTAEGFGGSFTAVGRFFERDLFKLGYLFGSGITSLYQDTVGLNLDAAPESATSDDLKVMDSVSFWVSYNRYWGNGFASVISYAMTKLYSDYIANSKYLTGINGVYDMGNFISANITRNDNEGLTYGLEFIFGQKEITSKTAIDRDERASNMRLQFSMMYDIDWSKK